MTLKNIIAPEKRRSKLKKLLDQGSLIRVIEVHSGLSSLVANDVKVELENGTLEFDALWGSGFTDSASKGYPDADIVSYDSRINTINEILNVTNKSLIVDGDTGGDPNNFQYLVSKLERLGVSAVIIEDKKFPKRNSLESGKQILEDPDVFANKIKRGKGVLVTDDFMIIARIESFISGYGIGDALLRAKKYLVAGVDGIMIHSREKTPDEILKFAKEYDKMCEELGFRKPLICIPTTYNTITEQELEQNGFNIVIYANHLLRAAHKSMEEVCKMILSHKRAFETEPFCTPVVDVFRRVGFMDIRERDLEELRRSSKGKVIIPAAGEDVQLKNLLNDLPKAMLEINGKSMLQRQINTLNTCGINDIVVIRGYAKDKFNVNSVKYYDVEDHTKGVLSSIFAAKEEMENGFILTYSDIIFDESIVKNLLKSKEDITIVVDNSYAYHKHEIDKELDLIISKKRSSHHRELSSTLGNEISFIGVKLKKDVATHEFIGIVKFSKRGAENLISVYEDCKKNHTGKFHESESLEKASLCDMLQEMVDRGFKVHYIETNKGWIEIHNENDYETAKKIIS